MDIFALNSLLIVSLSVFLLSDARARIHQVLIQYFKNLGCRDRPLYKNANLKLKIKNDHVLGSLAHVHLPQHLIMFTSLFLDAFCP